MAETKKITDDLPKKTKLEVVVTPIKSDRFLLAKAAYQQFNAYVPAGTTKKQLLDQKLWDHVANRIKLYDEIRVLELNGAFVAHMIVTFKFAGTIKVDLLSFHQLEEIDYGAESGMDKFTVVNRGAIGWCVVDNETSANVFTGLESREVAFKKMEKHVTTLGR